MGAKGSRACGGSMKSIGRGQCAMGGGGDRERAVEACGGFRPCGRCERERRTVANQPCQQAAWRRRCLLTEAGGKREKYSREKIARDEGNIEMKPEGGARDRRDWRESDARVVAREGKGVSTEKTNKKGCAVVGTFGRHFTPTGDVGGKVWGVQRARVRGNGRVMCRSTRWTDVQVGS